MHIWAAILCLVVSADPVAVHVQPLRPVTSLYDDPLAHSPRDMDGPHENTHGVNSRVRNLWMRDHPGKWNAVYVLHGKAFLIQEPPLQLSDVARAIPPSQRGRNYQLYLVSQARYWENEPLMILDEFGAYLNGLECDLSTTTPHNSIRFQHDTCLEFFVYARVLSQLAHKCPNYDASQLDAVIAYQARRLLQLRQTMGEP